MKINISIKKGAYSSTASFLNFTVPFLNIELSEDTIINVLHQYYSPITRDTANIIYIGD